MLDNLFAPIHLIILLGILGGWLLVLYAVWRSFQALLNIERNIGDIANTLRNQQLK